MRAKGYRLVFQDMDGKVYATANKGNSASLVTMKAYEYCSFTADITQAAIFSLKLAEYQQKVLSEYWNELMPGKINLQIEEV